MDFKKFINKYQKAEVTAYPNKVSNNPVVSVMVQTYNHEGFLQQCLDAILAQHTTFKFEVLLGEDASSDKTREICIKYAEEYPDKIRLFLHHPDNKIRVLDHLTGNYNAFYNFFQAQGTYIAFCEGDDYWTDPLKLQKQIDFLRQNSAFVLSYHPFEEIYEATPKNKKPIPLEQPSKDLNKEELSRLIYHPLLSTVCFRNCFRDLPEEMIQIINVDSFLLSILGNFGKAKYQSEITASIYRRHSGGIWSKKSKEAKFFTKILTYQKLIAWYKYNMAKEQSLYFQRKLKQTRKMLLFFYLKERMFLKVSPLLSKLLGFR